MIGVFGAGALGREIVEAMESRYLLWCDDNLQGSFIDGCAILSPASVPERVHLVIAVASPTQREAMRDCRPDGQRWGAACHGRVAASARLGPGAIVMPQSLVSVGAEAGAHLIVGPFSSIGHDVSIGDFCTLSSHVDLCGRVRVGDRVFFGSGARVLPGVTIGSDAYIGAGAVVVAYVAPGQRVFGNPARPLATPPVSRA